jgi:predicted deacylase
MIAPAEVRAKRFETGVHRYWLAVGSSWLGPTPLPLIVVQGANPGPRVVVIAAQHGDEGYAVIGAHRLAEELDPAELAGSVWLLPCLNVHGYMHGSRVSPFDHHDMNRVHPGPERGTVTEQISHALLEHLLPGADLLIDLHGGSPENGDVPFGRWSDVEGRASLENLVRALPLDFVIAPGSRDLPGMLSGVTSAIGVPQIAIEACNAYGRTTDNAAVMADFVTTALRYLGMLRGPKPEPQALPVRSTATHRAHTGGAWESFVTFGEEVARGQVLGVVRNLLGERVQTVTASAAGRVAVMRTGTRVHPGETLCTLAVTPDG